MNQQATQPPQERDADKEAMRALAEAIVSIALKRHANGERWDSAAKLWRRPA